MATQYDSNQQSLGAICVVLAYYCFRLAREHAATAKTMEAAPEERIRSAAMGRCQLVGNAAPFDELLSAPLSGEPCVWYRWEVLDGASPAVVKVGQGELRGSGISEKPFRLTDGHDSVLVFPKHADTLNIVSHKTWEAGQALGGVPDGPKAASFFKAGEFNFARSASEWIIKPGQNLVVSGKLVPARYGEGDPQPQIQDASPEIPLVFAVGWDRSKTWDHRKKSKYNYWASLILFLAGLFLFF